MNALLWALKIPPASWQCLCRNLKYETLLLPTCIGLALTIKVLLDVNILQ
jgi:hypothetical protein